MAEVRLPQRDGTCFALPPICIRCGRPSTAVQNVSLAVGIVALSAVTIPAPVCRFHWWSSHTMVFALAIAAYCIVRLTDGVWAIFLGLFGGGATFVVGHDFAKLNLTATGRTAGSISVRGVCDAFADAVGRIPICQTCGYDLTGNVSGVCPECGAPKRVGWTPDL